MAKTKQQKPKPTYCKVCGSLDIYNGEHDMCRAIDVARQQTALATKFKFRKWLADELALPNKNGFDIMAHFDKEFFGDEKNFKKELAEIKKLQNEN